MAADADSDLIENLLALPAPGREDCLRSRGLLNEPGLSRLLDAAEELVHSDPGRARRLAEACAGLAEVAGAPAIEPRAIYLCVETNFINGRFEEALRLARTAQEGYLRLGRVLETLRTNVGQAAVLLELGHYREALGIGHEVLEALKGIEGPHVEERDVSLLTALTLQNIGGCYEYMGRYEEALEAYTSAESAYQELGMTERLGEIRNNRGLILLDLGRSRDALNAFKSAADFFAEAGLTLSYAKALNNVGEAHLRLGNYRDGLSALEEARRLLDSIEALADRHLLLRDTADAYLALNLYSEALAAYREASEALQRTGMSYERARALWGLGSALAFRSNLEEAESTLAEAASLFSEAGNLPLLSGVMLEQAALLEARGRHEAALQKASEALELVSGRDWPVQNFYARLRLADLRLTGPEEAERHLLEAKQIAESLALPNLRYRVNERLGNLHLLKRRLPEARELLQAAVDEIENLRGTVTQEAIRASFLKDKLAAYEGLLRVHLARRGQESVREAFAAAERAKSRALVDLLTGIVGKEPSTGGELQHRIQELQADLNAIYNQMLEGTGEEILEPGSRAAELETEINRLRIQAAATASPDPFAASPNTTPDRLPADEFLAAYHIVGEEILAFISDSGDLRVVRNLGAVAEVRELLQRFEVQMDRFRAGQGFTERHMEVMHRSVRRVLGALYGVLFAPLEELLERDKEVRRLAIIPHGLLHRVPFHALFDGERYLLERFEISYAPSATVYALCQERVPQSTNRALALGLSDPSIPATMAEAKAVARIFPDSELLLDKEATIEAFKSSSAGRGVLHLACHGLFRSDNPMFSSLKLHDGWLTAADAMNLNLEGALVTLSACESGRNEVIGGDEILGLTRAFLGTGATTLVVSLWLVQDETTAELMQSWYGHLQEGLGRAEALRVAQLEIKARHPHPYYWAPFVLVGRR
ncbi:CHAT domain-containing protein [Rubrobacter taiwanensis]|uniref:CHAT domain-containing protein n=1 Tax=Rubrobacter taiwanensis TaxID=185139 RepID=A0A4R1BLL2_9ACTN|nr:CHAT domain-containing protein [Rubrobacter taiwanensis]TCJ18325.1 CHAT domain-containing protein [Rubrobacter taiwanensis]